MSTVAKACEAPTRRRRIKRGPRTLTVRDIASKVLADDDVPCGAVSSVELLLDLCSDVFLDVVLLERGGRDVDRLLLHLLAHVDVLDDRLRPRAGRVRRGVGRGGDGFLFLRHIVCDLRDLVWRGKEGANGECGGLVGYANES